MPKTLDDKYTVQDLETGEFVPSPALLDLEEEMVRQANYLNRDGSENPDPTPMAPPIGYVRQPSIIDRVRDMIRDHAIAQALAAQGVESFEEADDFNIPDDPLDPSSPWEGEFEPVGTIRDELEQKYAPKPPAAEPPPAPAEQPPQAAQAASAAPPKP